MSELERRGSEPSAAAEDLQRAADRLRTEVVGSLIEEGERIWRRLADAHEGAEDRVRRRVADLEQDVNGRLEARVDDEAAKLAEYAEELERLSQRRLEAHAAALTEAVATRAGELVAPQVIQLRSETAGRLGAHAREIVELARISRNAEAEREQRLERGLAAIDERSGAAVATRVEALERAVLELVEELELRSRPRPLDIPRPNANGASTLERRP